ncbi:hypothetical protein DXG01_002842 [Tephrocybe rancida]|nr:hypothetical protein DXG01_002842 [Tephrocybe rancida]
MDTLESQVDLYKAHGSGGAHNGTQHDMQPAAYTDYDNSAFDYGSGEASYKEPVPHCGPQHIKGFDSCQGVLYEEPAHHHQEVWYEGPAYHQEVQYEDPAYHQEVQYEDPAHRQEVQYEDPTHYQEVQSAEPAHHQQAYAVSPPRMLANRPIRGHPYFRGERPPSRTRPGTSMPPPCQQQTASRAGFGGPETTGSSYARTPSPSRT